MVPEVSDGLREERVEWEEEEGESIYSDLMAILAEWIMPNLSVSLCLSASMST
jgi:hypothetical protein